MEEGGQEKGKGKRKPKGGGEKTRRKQKYIEGQEEEE
jgi:hypothetical protein